jgi:hypothetical protein
MAQSEIPGGVTSFPICLRGIGTTLLLSWTVTEKEGVSCPHVHQKCTILQLLKGFAMSATRCPAGQTKERDIRRSSVILTRSSGNN